jgi:hypothetical protein
MKISKRSIKMDLKVGDCIRVQTKTRDDVFGVCFYEILETEIKPPERGREKETDGIKAVMLGGSGPAAREGVVIYDSWLKISQEIKSGIVEVMSKGMAEKLLADTPKSSQKPGDHVARPSTGVMELD